MDYAQIIEQLKSWQPDELLFRDNVLVQWGELDREEFLERHGSRLHRLDMALHPDKARARPMDNDLIPQGRNASIVRFPRYLPLNLHSHEFFEMIYVLSGECVLHFRDDNRSLAEGDFCLLAPEVEHGIEVCDDDSIVLNILVRYGPFLDIFAGAYDEGTLISQFILENIYSQKKPQHLLFHTGGDELVRRYLLAMCREMQTYAEDYSDRVMCSLITLFLTQLVRRHEPVPDTTSPNNGRGEIIEYIASHYTDVTVADVAEKFHFSRQYCSRLVKSLTGMNFIDLLAGIRVQQSENLLKYTDLSVTDIAARVGYANPEVFIRLFKRRKGCTPGQYRSRQASE